MIPMRVVQSNILTSTQKFSRPLLASVRNVLNELRLSSAALDQSNLAVWRQSPVYGWITHEVRSGQINESFLDIYALHLRGLRVNAMLSHKYKGKGERSIEESANLVGLKLPEMPRN